MRVRLSQRGIPLRITFDGRTQTAAEWAAESPLKLSADTIYQRIARHSWTAEEALTTPALPGGWGQRPPQIEDDSRRRQTSKRTKSS